MVFCHLSFIHLCLKLCFAMFVCMQFFLSISSTFFHSICILSYCFLSVICFYASNLFTHSAVMFFLSVCYHIIHLFCYFICALNIIENEDLPSVNFQDLKKVEWMNELYWSSCIQICIKCAYKGKVHTVTVQTIKSALMGQKHLTKNQHVICQTQIN